MKTLGMLAALASIILALACSQEGDQPQPSHQADIQALEQLYAKMDPVIEKGDLETLLTFFTEDAVVMVPNEASMIGKEAIRTQYRNLFDNFDIEIKHEPVEIHGFDDVVIEQGTGRGTLKPKDGGEPLPFDNKYLHVLRRQTNGALKIWWGMFNSNVPPPVDQ